MILGSADRRDREVLLERIDARAMALSGCDGGVEWPPEPSERGGYGLLMLLALMSPVPLVPLVPLVLSKWKLRIKRSSSLVKRETASLKGYGGLREPVNKSSLGCESAEDSEGEVGSSGLGLVLPSETVLDARRGDKIRSEGGEKLAGKSDNARHGDA